MAQFPPTHRHDIHATSSTHAYALKTRETPAGAHGTRRGGMSTDSELGPPTVHGAAPWRRKLHEVIFEAETPAGRAFDVGLFWAIGLSILAVSLESIAAINEAAGPWLVTVEWTLTVLFTVEYVLRLMCVERPLRYALSFYGVVDLLSILPTYLGVFVGGARSLVTLRALRLLRVFRVLKLVHISREATTLLDALRASRSKILVFLVTVSTLVMISGTLMYLVESHSGSGFSSIPVAMYWAVVTMTTVGYGDIAPSTPLGQALAAMLMVSGYAIIAVPTGIVSAELIRGPRGAGTGECRRCGAGHHIHDARYCMRCGAALAGEAPDRPDPA